MVRGLDSEGPRAPNRRTDERQRHRHHRWRRGRTGDPRRLVRPGDPCRRSVPHDPGHVGDERLDPVGGQRSRDHGHRHPDGHHALHLGDGGIHDHRWQDRCPHRAATGLRHRTGHLRQRFTHHRPVPESDRADHRVVGTGGARSRADHAGHRRPGGRQLPQRAPISRLRPHRRRRRHRRRRGTAGRWGGDHVRLVALGLRR